MFDLFACYTATEFIVIDSARIASSWRIHITTAAVATFSRIGASCPAARRSPTTSTSSSVTGRLTFAGFPIVWSVQPLGLSMTASRITKRFSTAMRTLRSSRSTIPRSTCTSKRKRSGYTIRTRISGASTFWTWTKALSTCRQLLVNLPAIAASSTIRNNIRGARSWCATSG